MNKLKFFIYFSLIVGLLLLLKFKEQNYYRNDTFKTANTINAVIEIPAGTNNKVEYNYIANKFVSKNEFGEKRVIDFLPYPANYGFIPSTLMDTLRGGDGDALDILVIAESLSMKTVVEVIPIAVLRLLDNNEIDDKIIAIPANADLQIINVLKFSELENNYPEILNILKAWFTSYKGKNKTEFIEWQNEKEAMKIIAKWAV